MENTNKEKNENKKAKRKNKKGISGFKAFFMGVLVGLVIIAGFAVYKVFFSDNNFGNNNAQVEVECKSYLENISTSGKLVLVTANQRLVISETTTGYLFGNTKIGKLLDIRSDATISAAAWTELNFVIDLESDNWDIKYNPSTKELVFMAPPLSLLTPAIHTDTIEIITTKKSWFLNEKMLEEESLKSLTSRFTELAKIYVNDSNIIEKAQISMKNIIQKFVDKTSLDVKVIRVQFGE